MAVSFILLNSPQTVEHGSHDRAAGEGWVAPASPFCFILDQRLMGKLFRDPFLSASENSSSGSITGAICFYPTAS